MVIDSSALIAILPGETEAEGLARALANAPRRLLRVFSALETSIVSSRRRRVTMEDASWTFCCIVPESMWSAWTWFNENWHVRPGGGSEKADIPPA